MNFLMTVDVEHFSIPLNRFDKSVIPALLSTGLPRLINLFSTYDLPATFYFTGELAEIAPEALEFVAEHGHEVGCHGYSHQNDRALDMLAYSEQYRDLVKAKTIIESIAGRIESFRAPALRINTDTITILEKLGYRSDSSVCPQRFDGPFTFGSRGKMRWLTTTRKPFYHQNTGILEIPISALIVPYIGTTMRISPGMIQVLEKILFFESRKTDKPIVFLFHPNECLDEEHIRITTKRSSNIFGYFFADYVRQQMKLKNMGEKAVNELERIIKAARSYEFEFCTVSDYRRSF